MPENENLAHSTKQSWHLLQALDEEESSGPFEIVCPLDHLKRVLPHRYIVFHHRIPLSISNPIIVSHYQYRIPASYSTINIEFHHRVPLPLSNSSIVFHYHYRIPPSYSTIDIEIPPSYATTVPTCNSTIVTTHSAIAFHYTLPSYSAVNLGFVARD